MFAEVEKSQKEEEEDYLGKWITLLLSAVFTDHHLIELIIHCVIIFRFFLLY